jgi:hypothetical protein
MKLIGLPLLLLLASCGDKKANSKSGESDSVNKPHIMGSAAMPRPGDSMEVNTPGPLTQLVNDSLNHISKNNWHVLNDHLANWKKETFDYFIATKRLDIPDYPYACSGDFNGDGKTDYAAVTKEEGMQNYRIAIIQDGKIIYWDEDVLQNAALKTRTASELMEQTEENPKPKKIVMKGDGIEVEYFEQASYVIYWDGKKFSKVQEGD